jgi:hypothetical protein
LSLNQPLKTRTKVAVLSAMPSMSPMIAVPTPRTLAKNKGNTVNIISLETSVRKLVNPKKKTLGLRPNGLGRPNALIEAL